MCISLTHVYVYIYTQFPLLEKSSRADSDVEQCGLHFKENHGIFFRYEADRNKRATETGSIEVSGNLNTGGAELRALCCWVKK